MGSSIHFTTYLPFKLSSKDEAAQERRNVFWFTLRAATSLLRQNKLACRTPLEATIVMSGSILDFQHPMVTMAITVLYTYYHDILKLLIVIVIV